MHIAMNILLSRLGQDMQYNRSAVPILLFMLQAPSTHSTLFYHRPTFIMLGKCNEMLLK